jgi:hypothetical protein
VDVPGLSRGYEVMTTIFNGGQTTVAAATIGAWIMLGAQAVRATNIAAGAVAAQDAQDSNDKISVWNGVYTEEQAKRG